MLQFILKTNIYDCAKPRTQTSMHFEPITINYCGYQDISTLDPKD